MKSIYLSMLIIFLSIGCSPPSERLKKRKESLERESKTYIITCEMPVDEKRVYQVNYENASNAFHVRAGVWRFTTIKGKKIMSTTCHLEM